MNQNILEKQRTLRFKTPIILLSLISLLFELFSCITYFVNYDFEYNDGNSFYELTVGFPGVIALISLLIYIAPYVLFVVYLLKFHNKFKATILVPITFGLIAFAPVYTILENTIYYGISFGYSIINIPIIVAFALATINALKGFSKKVFLIIAIAVGLLVEFIQIYSFSHIVEYYLEEEQYLYLFTQSSDILGTFAFYIALLLFGLKNRIPAIISVSYEKENRNSNEISPELALRDLKDKLDLGIITEEEYQSQRTDIINKL